MMVLTVAVQIQIFRLSAKCKYRNFALVILFHDNSNIITSFPNWAFLHTLFSAPLILSRLAPTQHSTYGSPEMIRRQFQFLSAWEAIQHLRAFRAANHLEEVAGYAYSWCRDPLVSSSLGAVLLFHGVSISNT